MTKRPRHVLLVGTETSALQGVAPMLRRAEFEIHTVPPSDLVLDLIQGTSFELLVVTYPLPDLSLEELLKTARREESGCRGASLLLLSDPDKLDSAQEYVDQGANRAISIDWAESRMWQAFSDLLEVAPRISMRMVVHLAIRLEEDTSVVQGQTVNLSRSGMLLCGPADLAPGTPFDFIFAIPGQQKPIRGTAEVVRMADPGKEGMVGYGVRFLSFRDQDKDRLTAFVRSQLGDEGLTSEDE